MPINPVAATTESVRDATNPEGSVAPRYRTTMGPPMSGVSNGSKTDPASIGASGLTRTAIPLQTPPHPKQPAIGSDPQSS